MCHNDVINLKILFQAKEALLQAHDQIKKLHITVDELKGRVSLASEENSKLSKENLEKSEQIDQVESSTAAKERALLEKIKTIESEQNELRGNYSALKRYDFT